MLASPFLYYERKGATLEVAIIWEGITPGMCFQLSNIHRVTNHPGRSGMDQSTNVNKPINSPLPWNIN